MKIYKKRIILFLTAMIISTLASCRPESSADVNITGLWKGTIESNSSTLRGENFIVEFFKDGSLKMGDPNNLAVFSKVHDQEIDFRWLQDGYNLEVTSFTKLYYLQFYYNLISEDELEIILLKRNYINDSYDHFNPGDRILLNKHENTEFSKLMGW